MMAETDGDLYRTILAGRTSPRGASARASRKSSGGRGKTVRIMVTLTPDVSEWLDAEVRRRKEVRSALGRTTVWFGASTIVNEALSDYRKACDAGDVPPAYVTQERRSQRGFYVTPELNSWLVSESMRRKEDPAMRSRATKSTMTLEALAWMRERSSDGAGDEGWATVDVEAVVRDVLGRSGRPVDDASVEEALEGIDTSELARVINGVAQGFVEESVRRQASGEG